MSVFISSFNSDAPIKTYNIPGTATLKLKLPAYNKHRDGSWPTTDSQRAYIQHQRALYNNNLIRLYYAFQATMRQRIAELGGNASQAMAETSAEVQAQAQHLYYDRVWNKSNAGGKKLDSLLYRAASRARIRKVCPNTQFQPNEAPAGGAAYLMQIYRFWRDVGTAQEHRLYDCLWEFVASRELPKKMLTASHERKPWI